MGYRHRPHRGNHSPADGFDDNPCLRIGNSIGRVDGPIRSSPHIIVSHQRIQRIPAVRAYFGRIFKFRQIIRFQVIEAEGAAQNHRRILPGHGGHRVETVIRGRRGQNPHIQGRFHRFHVIIPSGHVKIVSHALLFQDIAVTVDISSVIHDAVIVIPAEITGQTDHKIASRHWPVYLDRMGARCLACVEIHGIYRSFQRPGYLNIISAYAVPHDNSTIRIYGYEMLIARPPGTFRLLFPVYDGYQFHRLDKFERIGLTVHIHVPALDVDTALGSFLFFRDRCGAFPFFRSFRTGGGRGSGASRQNRGQADSGGSPCHSLHELTSAHRSRRPFLLYLCLFQCFFHERTLLKIHINIIDVRPRHSA